MRDVFLCINGVYMACKEWVFKYIFQQVTSLCSRYDWTIQPKIYFNLRSNDFKKPDV